VRVQYLLPGGGVLTKDYAVAAESRYTIYVDAEQIPAESGQRPLAATAVAMRFTSLNGVPIVVERSMWWPQPVWYEAHNVVATTAAATRWAVAGGITGGPNDAETYLLIANVSPNAGQARVRLLFEDPLVSAQPVDIALPPNSRTNVAVGTLFPAVRGQPFGAVVESLGASPVPIVVERAIYETIGGVTWSAGTAIVATPLTP
jgi:hypothetical protein